MMQVLFPHTLAELHGLRQEYPDGRILAGGTDLLVKLRHTAKTPPAVFALERIDELGEVTISDTEISIGAAVTLQRLLECDTVKTEFSGLYQAIETLASPPVRHGATLAGNVCTASPAGDSLPPLYVFGATIEVSGPSGCRSVSLADFILGPGMTVLQPSEVVTAVRIRRSCFPRQSVYHKVGKRRAMAIAVASMAALLEEDETGGRRIRLAWGSVGPTVVTAPAIERLLEERGFDNTALCEAGQLLAAVANPIDDIRASAEYRRRLAANLLLRLADDFGVAQQEGT